MKTRLEEFTELTPAEQRLRDEVCLGDVVLFGRAEGQTEIAEGNYVPDAKHEDAPTITADFLRYLILGGCEGLDGTIPATGVRIAGARVSGQLTLEGEAVTRDIALVDCVFDRSPVFQSARLRSLFLNGSSLPGLQGDRVTTEGSVFLRRITATGDDEFRLLGAVLGGALDCTGATLRGDATGIALIADRMRTADTVRFAGAQISGAVRLTGARVGGVLTLNTKAWSPAGIGSDEGVALRCDGARIDGAIIARDGGRIDGIVDFTTSRAGTLVDAPGKWPEDGRLFLDRFIYGAFAGDSVPTDAPTRIAWLDSQVARNLADEFKPQPWEHCAKVLRESGHANAAREVMVAKERLQRRAARNKLREQKLFLEYWLRATIDGVLWWTVAYGRKPLRAVWSMLFIFLVGTCIFFGAAREGAIKPNNPVVLTSDGWVGCAGDDQLDCFLSGAGQGYPRFDAWIYSLDTLVPLVSLEMQTSWLPDDTRPGWGAFASVYLWIHIALGWALSLLAVAGFSGLIKQDNT